MRMGVEQKWMEEEKVRRGCWAGRVGEGKERFKRCFLISFVFDLEQLLKLRGFDLNLISFFFYSFLTNILKKFIELCFKIKK